MTKQFETRDEYYKEITTPERVKPMVQYLDSPSNYIVVGQSAEINTVDHPAQYLNKSRYGVVTSKVVSYDEVTGEFETLNTKYVRAEVA